MNKDKDNKYLLNEGDSKVIADKLGCSYEQVTKMKAGKRGKRGTELQKKIKRVLEYRTRQNENLLKFCNEIKISQVVPK